MRSFYSCISLVFLAVLAACVTAASSAMAVESFENSGGAPADPAPGVGSICLHERVVFRPKVVGSLEGAEPGDRIELVRETVCEDAERSCMAAGLCR